MVLVQAKLYEQVHRFAHWCDLVRSCVFYAWVQTAGGPQGLLLGCKELICAPGHHICTKQSDSLLSAPELKQIYCSGIELKRLEVVVTGVNYSW